MERARAEALVSLCEREGVHALICRLPQHVLMLTGYLPVLGNDFCIVTLRDGTPTIYLVAAQSEERLIPKDVAAEISYYSEETLEKLEDTLAAVREPLRQMFGKAHLEGGVKLGYEGVKAPFAPAYTQVSAPGTDTFELYKSLLPSASWHDATPLLHELAAVKMPSDLDVIRKCIAVAREGFDAARGAIHVGATEAEVEAATMATMLRAGYAQPGIRRVFPHVHVMSGVRSEEAYKPFNLTSGRSLELGDPVLVQMEVGLDGYWCELTRTFFVEEAADIWQRAYAASRQAQDAALAVIREGISGSEADAAARQVMEREGFGKDFRTGLGHGFGFQAINHSALPVLHPVSTTTLRAGMVHNLEPAAYIEGVGGFRMNDDVLVTGTGNELLSQSISRELEYLIVRGQSHQDRHVDQASQPSAAGSAR